MSTRCRSCTCGVWIVLTNFIKLAVYLADFVTDIMLAAEYYRNGDTFWFALTLSFALVPQFFVNMILWYHEGRNLYTFPLYFLQLGVVWRHFQIVAGIVCGWYDPADIHAARKESEDDQEPVARTVHHNFPLVHLIGTLLESVPQICLQIYVAVVTGELQSWTVDTLKYVTMLMSLLAALKAVWDWEVHYLRDSACLSYGVVFGVWKVVELSARIVAISLFATLYSYWVFVLLGIHWFVMAVTENMVCSRHDDAKGWVDPDADPFSQTGNFAKILFKLLVVSPVDVFAWVTFGSRPLSKLQPIANGVLTFLGNYIMVLVWYFIKDATAWYDSFALSAVLAGTAVALLVKVLYLWCYVRQPCCCTTGVV